MSKKIFCLVIGLVIGLQIMSLQSDTYLIQQSPPSKTPILDTQYLDDDSVSLNS